VSIFPAKVLLATDGSEDAKLAADTALRLARKTGSELHVVHVLAWSSDRALDPEGLDPAVRQDVQSRASARLEELVSEIEASGGAVVGSHLGVGRTDAEIVARAEQMGAGLIVMGSRGLGTMRRALMGSVSESVVRHAHCPVIVVRGEPVVFPAKILLATDGSEEATQATRVAAEVAQRTGSDMQIVTVALENPNVYAYYDVRHPAEVERHRQEARKILDQQVDRVREAGANVAKAHLKMGAADEDIVVLAEDLEADLIIMGTRGLGALRRALMGSISDSVVRHAHCPVMVVRPEKERTPQHEADSIT
jgi:nucleotide-binding universal stress UspA family protein